MDVAASTVGSGAVLGACAIQYRYVQHVYAALLTGTGMQYVILQLYGGQTEVGTWEVGAGYIVTSHNTQVRAGRKTALCIRSNFVLYFIYNDMWIRG